MRLGTGRSVLLLILVSTLCTEVTATTPEPGPALETRQTIVKVNRYLENKGWQEERRCSEVPLSSLSTCSGTGIGFCWFDYQKNHQRLSVVTVPSQPGQPSVGRVTRWW